MFHSAALKWIKFPEGLDQLIPQSQRPVRMSMFVIMAIPRDPGSPSENGLMELKYLAKRR